MPTMCKAGSPLNSFKKMEIFIKQTKPSKRPNM